MTNPLFAFLVLAFSLTTSVAFAECDPDEEMQAGKAIAAATAASVVKAVPITGKQIMNINICEGGGGKVYAKFKFNFLGADGLYWVEGAAKLTGSSVTDLKFSRLSPNLAEASAKVGVQLAGN